MKTLQQVIAEAQRRGYVVKYRTTSEDGWTRIRITEITTPKGQTTKYTASKGNTALRASLGHKLGKKAVAARTKAAKLYSKQGGRVRARGAKKLTKEERNAIKRINAQLKKKGLKERATISNYRRRKQREGERSVRGAINNTLMHYADVAYPASIGDTIITIMSKAARRYPKTLDFLEGLVHQRNGTWYYFDQARTLKDTALFEIRQMMGTSLTPASQSRVTTDKVPQMTDEERDEAMLEILKNNIVNLAEKVKGLI